MIRRRRWTLAVLVATIAPAAAVPPASVPRALSQLQDLGPAPRDLPLTHMTVVLGLRDPAGLAALVAAQQDPHTQAFQRWIDTQEIADRFGPRPAEYERVRRWLGAQGLEIVRDSPLRTTIVAAGTAASVEQAFGTPLRLFRHRDRLVHGSLVEPNLPGEVAPLVRGVLGLDDLPRFHPLVKLEGDTGACGMLPSCATLAPADFATVYGVDGLLARGYTGNGRTIAVIARSNFHDADVAQFANTFNVGRVPRPPQRAFSGVDPGVLTAEGEETEVLLDAQWAAALAPGAQVKVVIGSLAGDVDEALVTAVEQRAGDVVSLSFGLCELASSALRTELFDAFYTIGNAQGQTILVAAGDDGSDDCNFSDVSGRSVNLLAASPHAVAVGGTALDPGFDAEGTATGRVRETVWNDDYGAGGGGESVVFARPRFQLGPGVPVGLHGRAMPDVALVASPLSAGYVIVQGGKPSISGGTSASTPALASALALISERLGVVGGLGQFLPALYRAAGDQGRTFPAAFYDIVEGNNATTTSGFSAAPGFDLASGWGAPDVTRLADALAGPQRCEPELACMVPGTPALRHSCRGEWLVDRTGHTLDGRGLPARRQFCRDGDPTCDLDGTANGQCTIAVALCLNVFDFRTLSTRGLPVCTPGKIRNVTLTALGGHGADTARRNREVVREAVHGLPPLPSQLTGNCTASAPVDVPIPPHGRAGRVRLRARIDHTTSRLTLVCQP